MRKVLAAVAAGLVLVGGAVFTANSAMAEPTADCRIATVKLTDRPDTGADGSVWAKDALARTMKVCVEAAKPVAAADEGALWNYSAVITDKGTFKTVEGTSPKDSKPLAAGIEGSVDGGFVADFTAPANWNGWLGEKDLKNDTKTSAWVWTAFPGAKGNLVGKYRWEYANPCQTYLDDNGTYTGDITAKCVAPAEPKVTKATCDAAGELVIPQTVGVKYVVGTKQNGKVKVTAKAKPGYLLSPKEGGWAWTLTIPEQLPADSEACKKPTTPPTTNPTTPPSNPGSGGGSTTTPSQTTEAPAGNNGGSDNGGNLALTGSNKGTLLGMLGTGVLLFSVGGLLLVWARRRRDAGAVESA